MGAREVREFTGALEGKRAKKGIFITTASFSKSALEFVEKIGSKVMLIDGKKLAVLMIRHDVGVSTIETLMIKKVDSDYLESE